MTRIAAVAMGFIGVCSNAFGGMVVFSPDRIDAIEGTVGMIDFEVSFVPDQTATGLSLDAFDAVFGSARVPLANFVFSDRITGAGGFPNSNITPNPGIGAYTNELYISANRGAPNDPPIPNLPIGTLTIDLSALEVGTYSVVVDNELDFGLSQLLNRGAGDPLQGSLPVTVHPVPEPASISLLALGALAALRFGRRRSAR